MTQPLPESAVQELLKLHARVDRAAAALAAEHAGRLKCAKGCSACCLDGLRVFEIEAERIRRNHASLLVEGQPHPAGACAFLDESGACRIYEDRPYVCRTQGLPLRWIDEDEQGSNVEYRDICPLNDEGPALTKIAAHQCWTLGPVEAELRELQSSVDGGRGTRVSLRSLFKRKDTP